MEKTDGREVRLDRRGGFLLSLEIRDIRINMLRRNVRQPLQAIDLRQEAAEPLHGFIVPGPRLIAALAVMTVELVHLEHEIKVMIRHKYILSFFIKGRTSPIGTIWPFPAFLRRTSQAETAPMSIGPFRTAGFIGWEQLI